MAATHPNAGIAATCFLKTKGNAEVHSYQDAAAFLGGSSQRTIASNVTIVRRSPSSIAVRLYQTNIITYHADGTFEADNGGYATPTTSTRCNQFGPRGYYFCHGKYKLLANGKPTGPGVRFPVRRPEPATLATAGVYIPNRE